MQGIIYSGVDVNQGQSYWSLNGTGVDEWGGNTMNFTSVSATTGIVEQGYNFGYPGYSKVSAFSDMKSLSFWFKSDTSVVVNSNLQVFMQPNESTTYSFISIGAVTGHYADEMFVIYTSTGSYYWTDSDIGFSTWTTAWHHIALVWNVSSSNYILFINGTDKGHATKYGSPGEIDEWPNPIFGRRTAAAQYFEGVFDEIAYWNDSLDNNEVSAIYNHQVDGYRLDEESNTTEIDAYCTSLNPSTNYGDSVELAVGTNYSSLMKFNISHIPYYNKIEQCILHLYVGTNDLDYSGEGFNVSVFLVNQSSYSWDESTVTHNTQPSPNDLVVASESENRYFGGAGEPANEWNTWNVTDLCYRFGLEGYSENITFFLNITDVFGSPASGDQIHFHSSESSTILYRPYLNLTYTNQLTFYVSSVNGNDSNNGRSSGAPFKTLSKLASEISSNDIALLEKGSIFREVLHIDDDNVIVGVYGTGENPVILGSVNLSSIGNWSSVVGNIYKSENNIIDVEPTVMLYDTNNGALHGNCTIVSNYVDLNEDWECWINTSSDSVYTYLSTGNPGAIANGIELPTYSTYGSVVYITGDYVTLENMTIRYSEDDLLKIYNSAGTRISDVLLEHAQENGLFTSASNDLYVDNMTVKYCGYQAHQTSSGAESVWISTCTDCLIENSEIVYYPNVGVNFWHTDNASIKNSYIHDSYKKVAWAGGIYFDGCQDGGAYYNNISNALVGININSEIAGYNSTNIEIQNNVVEQAYQPFHILCSLSSICAYDINVSHNNFLQSEYDASYSPMIYWKYVDNLTFKDNIVRNNHTNSSGYLLSWNNGTTGYIDSDYNLWYSEIDRDHFTLNGAYYTSLSAFASGTSNDTNSLYDDPMFVSGSYYLLADSPGCGDGVNGDDIGAYPCSSTFSPAAPTSPLTISINKDFNLANDLVANASGSTDINNDTITYYYRFYNIDDSQLLQDYSTNNSYVLQTTDMFDRIQISAFASDGTLNSSAAQAIRAPGKVYIYAYNNYTGASINNLQILTDYRNYSSIDTGEYIYLNYGSYNVTISAQFYSNTTVEKTITNISLSTNITVYLSQYNNFHIYNEQDGLLFNTNETTSTKVWYYCPGDIVSYDFNVTANENTAFIPVTCAWDFIKLDVTYAGDSYFRAISPLNSETTIDFYVLDLTEDTGVQVIFELNDLVGNFIDGYLILEKPVNGTSVVIHKQTFDAQNRVVAYLLKDGYYTLKIQSADLLTTRSIGYIIAEAAGTKTLTIPDIDFVPESYLGNLIHWSWEESNSSRIHLEYRDDTSQYTSYLTFTVYNTTSDAVLYTTTDTNISSASYTYLTPNENATYLACINGTHSVYGDVDDCHMITGSDSMPDVSGFDADEEYQVKKWASLLVCMLLLLGAGYFNVTAGMGLFTFFMWFFMHFGWLTLDSSITDYGVLSILTFLTVLVYWLEGNRK